MKNFKVKIKGLILISALTLALVLPSPALAEDPLKKKQEIENLEKQISAVQTQIDNLDLEMRSLKGRLDGVKQEIAKNDNRLKKLNNEIDMRTRILEKRVKILYKEDDAYNLSLILNSDGFFDFLRRIRFLIYISKADAENVKELKKARKEAQEVSLMLKDSKVRLEQYLQAYKERVDQLNSLKSSLNEMLVRAKKEYNLMLNPTRLRKVVSRGYITRGGGYAPGAYVPRKFVEVSPYGQGFLTSGRMPQSYEASGKKWVCYASWYGNEFHGRRTASGEIFNQWDFTVAHRSLPFGTFVLIRRGDRAIVAKVTDRGPFVAGREFDLSRACAEALGFSGVAKIEVEIIFPK